MNHQPDLSRTWAVVVGINHYEDPAIGDLQHQADHARRFAAWLIDRGVAPARILLFLSPGPDFNELGVNLFDARENTIFEALDGRLRRQDAQQDLLLLYWGGHGLIAGDQRALLAADAETQSLRCINLDNLLSSLRTEYFPFDRQAAIVDSCASHFPNKDEIKPREFRQTNRITNKEQFVLFSAADAEAARDGLFSLVALEWLERERGWPPDLDRMAQEVRTHFDELLKQGLAAQTPICIRHRGWRGDESDLFGSLAEWQETSRDIREARALLDPIEFDADEWRAHYLATALYLDRPLPPVESREQMIRQLARASLSLRDESKSDRPRPLLEFAWRAARAAGRADLRAGVESRMTNKTQLATIKRRVERESLELPVCLLVELAATASLQRAFNTEFKWWLWDETRRKCIDQGLRPMDGSERDLQKVFSELLAECRERFAPERLRVEFFVSGEHLLSFDADQWEYKGGELGANFAVSLRLSGRREKRDWIEAARAIRGKSCGIQWLPDSRLPKRMLAPRIRAGKCHAVFGVSAPPLANVESLDLLETVLKTCGAPFALWPRAEGGIKPRLNRVAAAGPIEDLPDRIRDGRLEHPAPPLSLFWDDPERDPVAIGFSAP